MIHWLKPTTAIALLIMLLTACGGTDGRLINGATLPDVSLPSLRGNPMALSEFRGNIVLVDVWASWCKPCRKQNPQLVELYSTYKDRGFKIYSISLDSDRDAWVKAIKTDKLNWPYHVSELKGWGSIVVDAYSIGAIPTSFLLDENGMIIGKDLRVADLKKLLDKRLAGS